MLDTPAINRLRARGRCDVMTTEGLQSVLGSSFYAGAPNAGTRTQPTVVTANASAGNADYSALGNLGGESGRLPLMLYAALILGIAGIAYWLHDHSL